MAELKKVIKSIEDCVFHKIDCIDCDYDGFVFAHGDCKRDLLSDALDLLKEQEDFGTELTNAVELIHKKNERIEKLLKEQEAKPPIHIHEEYPEHDWERDKNGDIDDFAYDGDYHNGPACKRCNYAFCIHCDPNGWNREPCIIDRYKCPKCGRYIVRRSKFCSDCGQEIEWNECAK